MMTNNKETRLRFVFRPMKEYQGQENLSCIMAIREVREYGHIESSVVKAIYLPHDPITLNGYAYFKLATEAEEMFPEYLRLRYREEIGSIYQSLSDLYTFQASFYEHVEVAFDIMDDYELWSEIKYRKRLAAEQLSK